MYPGLRLLVFAYTLQVVDDMSSCFGIPSETTQHTDRNHMDMCRFTGANDIEYNKVIAALNRMTAAITKKPEPTEAKLPSESQIKELIEALEFEQMDARHLTIKRAHAKTCRWLLTRSEYLDWLDNSKTDQHHGFLWIKGKPGAGKSTLMKFALANARNKMKERVIISFFFNARGTILEKSTAGMYRSLLFQLVKELPRLRAIFASLGLTSSSARSNYIQSVETLKELFEQAVGLLGDTSVVCFIDALDECDEDQIRDMVGFFQELGQKAVASGVQFHVLFSSRHYPHIKINRGLDLVLERQAGHSQDITTYISNKLDIGGGKISEQVRLDLHEKAAGVFMWVVLVVDILTKEHARGRRGAQLRRKLGEIPSDLNELFRDILTRDRQDREELLLCIQWVLFAKQPLKPEELYFAIHSGTELGEIAQWDREECDMKGIADFILSSSKGLAEVTTSKIPTVQFIHESVRDFLLKERGLEAVWPDLGNNFEAETHGRLARCCLLYMSAPAVSKFVIGTDSDDTAEAADIPDDAVGTPDEAAESGATPDNAAEVATTPVHATKSGAARDNTAEARAALRQDVGAAFPFLYYSVQSILHHAEMAEAGGVSQKNFIQTFPRIKWLKLLNLFEKVKIRRHIPGTTLLYLLAEYGKPALIRVLPYRHNCFMVERERYGTPIFASIALQNFEAVRALMEVHLGAQPPPTTVLCNLEKELSGRKKLTRGFTFSRKKGLLYSVIASGSSSLLDIYLRTADGSVCAKDPKGWPSLHFAAKTGNETAVKFLLDTGQTDVNSRDMSSQYRKTALGLAAENGHEAVVMLLLASNQVDVNSKDYHGMTPLMLAARRRHEAVVKQLLATGQVDIESRGNQGLIPLIWAARGGHEAVVKQLLAAGQVDIELRDNQGLTPLIWAAREGHEAVVKQLLAISQVGIDSKDSSGKTPLAWAASYPGYFYGNRYEAVVKILLATGQVDINSRGKDGKTPLSLAIEDGNDNIVKLLVMAGGTR